MRITISLCALAAATTAMAGDLNPPGAPNPTMKTLVEVEPRIPIAPDTTPGDTNALFVVNQPGAYYLTGNVDVPIGSDGIFIVNNNVTIDLMGFRLRGFGGLSDHGVVAPPGFNDIRVTNGAIVGFSGNGVSLASASGVVITDCHLIGNDGAGARVGPHAVIRRVVARQNGGIGVDANSSATIVECVAAENGADGVEVGTAATISRSQSFQNCGRGFFIGPGSVISHCASSFNGDDGIAAISAVLISNNACTFNTGDGIEVDDQCHVIENTCNFNGNGAVAAGIHVTGVDNRIDGNSLTVSDIGLDVDGASNVIVRNTLSGNSTNFDIIASNRVGAIVVGPASGALVGSAPTSAGMGTTDPWANIVY